MEELAHTSFGKDMKEHFHFPEGYRNLNHGSFGATPNPVTDVRRKFQDQSEAYPDAFQRYQQPTLLLEARKTFAAALKTPYTNVVLVPNATTGVNAVLRNLRYEPGDQILYFSTIYGSCEKIVLSVCEISPARSTIIPLTYGSPSTSPSDDDVVSLLTDTITRLRASNQNPRIAIFDTITSMPGVRMPFEALTAVCKEHNILSLVDGAHGLGCTPLNVGELDPDFLVTNAHKWFYTPRSCAAFVVAERVQHLLRTSYPTSHGFEPMPARGPNGEVPDGPVVTRKSPLPPSAGTESAFARNFAFVGTLDVTSYLAGPAGATFRDVVCGGEEAIIGYCADLARRGGEVVAGTLGTFVMDNSDGSLTKGNPMVNVRLPLKAPAELATSSAAPEGTNGHIAVDEKVAVKVDERGAAGVGQWIEARTSEEMDTFINVFWHDGAWWSRVSAQTYLDVEDFEYAGRCLRELCGRVEKGEHLAKA